MWNQYIGLLYRPHGWSSGGKPLESVGYGGPESRPPSSKDSNSTFDGIARHTWESLSTSYLYWHARPTGFCRNLDQNYGHPRLLPFSQLPSRFGLTKVKLPPGKCSDRRMDLLLAWFHLMQSCDEASFHQFLEAKYIY